MRRRHEPGDALAGGVESEAAEEAGEIDLHAGHHRPHRATQGRDPAERRHDLHVRRGGRDAQTGEHAPNPIRRGGVLDADVHPVSRFVRVHEHGARHGEHLGRGLRGPALEIGPGESGRQHAQRGRRPVALAEPWRERLLRRRTPARGGEVDGRGALLVHEEAAEARHRARQRDGIVGQVLLRAGEREVRCSGGGAGGARQGGVVRATAEGDGHRGGNGETERTLA